MRKHDILPVKQRQNLGHTLGGIDIVIDDQDATARGTAWIGLA